MREQVVGKQKCERILKEEYEKKSYVSDDKIEDVRKDVRVTILTQGSLRRRISCVDVKRQEKTRDM